MVRHKHFWVGSDGVELDGKAVQRIKYSRGELHRDAMNRFTPPVAQRRNQRAIKDDLLDSVRPLTDYASQWLCQVQRLTVAEGANRPARRALISHDDSEVDYYRRAAVEKLSPKTPSRASYDDQGDYSGDAMQAISSGRSSNLHYRRGQGARPLAALVELADLTPK